MLGDRDTRSRDHQSSSGRNVETARAVTPCATGVDHRAGHGSLQRPHPAAEGIGYTRDLGRHRQPVGRPRQPGGEGIGLEPPVEDGIDQPGNVSPGECLTCRLGGLGPGKRLGASPYVSRIMVADHMSKG